MALTDYKVENNAETAFLWSISASATSIIVSWSEWDLFPSSFPFKITLEKFNSDTIPKVIKREIVTCTNRIWDSLTITRASESCVQNDTASPKTRTNNALAFDSGDKVSLYDTKSQRDDITDELIRLEEDKLDKSVYDSEKNVYWASSEWTDAYKITDASIISYSEKNIYKVKSDVANTWACTFEINSLGAKEVKKEQWTTDLIDNDWKAGWIATLQYNSTLDVFQFTWQNAILVSTSSESTQTEVTAWESISSWDALYYSPAINTTYQMSTASFEKVKSWLDSSPQDVRFKNDWTVMYILWKWSDDIEQFNLSTAWDIDTAWTKVATLSLSWQSITEGRFMAISEDWLKIYAWWISSDRVFQYSMSTAWDLSTASYDSKLYNSWDGTNEWLWFKEDWLKMYTMGNSLDTVRQHNLSTAWDISTASYASITISITWTNKNWLYFKPDWTSFYYIADWVWRKYTMSTEWNPSTWVLQAETLTLTTQDSQPKQCIYWNDWKNIYMVWDSWNELNQYHSWEIVNEWYNKTDASDSSKINFIWFASSSASLGWTLKVNTAWVDSNQSGLVVWSDYYLFEEEVWYNITSPTQVSTKDIGTLTSYGMTFNSDGDILYMSDYSWDRVYQYPLSTAWDISTASSSSWNLSIWDNFPFDISISTDWTELYIMSDSADTVRQYTLSTPFDVTSWSFTRAFSPWDSRPYGITFKNDWTKMYLGLWETTDAIVEYDLSTAWDISTTSVVWSYDISWLTNYGWNLELSNDWSKIYLNTIIFDSTDTLYEFTMSTNYDIETCSQTWAFSHNADSTWFAIWDNWKKLYINQDSSQVITEYNIFSTQAIPGAIWLQPWSNWIKVWKAVSATELLINTLPEQEADVDFLNFTTGWWGSSYSTTYNHNLWKMPTKFECFTNKSDSSGVVSYGWFEQDQYCCAGREWGSRSDCIWIIYYSSWDYFKMTINTITDTQFTITYTEVWTCSSVSNYWIAIRIQ